MSVNVDDMFEMIQDKASFLGAVDAIKSNMNGPPSLILPHHVFWPLFVQIGHKISPKMKEQTIDQVEEMYVLAEELYALSADQRSTIAKYKEQLESARQVRKNKKEGKSESVSTKKSRKPEKVKQNRVVELELKDEGPPQTPEAIERAERQARLFTKHDIEREEAHAFLGHHPTRVLGQLITACDMQEVVFGVPSPVRVGQVVVVPRSKVFFRSLAVCVVVLLPLKGGMCYAEVTGSMVGEKCFWNAKHSHPMQLVRVKYGSHQKPVPAPLLGRIR